MRVIKDSKVDTQRTTNTSILPVRSNVSTAPVTPTGSVQFDIQTNMFYGTTPHSLVPLGSRNIGVITTGVTPTGIAITPDGKKAYVANNNNYGIAGQDSVTVIDVATNLPKLIQHPSFIQPYTVTISKDGTKAYVTNSGSPLNLLGAQGTITVIDTLTDSVIGVINGFDGPSGMAIAPGTNKAYVNNYGGPGGVQSGNGTTVRVVNLLTNTITGPPIVVGLAPAAITSTPGGKFVYTANYVDGNTNTGTLSKIRTSDDTVVATIGPFSPNGFSGPFAIAITPDGTKALVTNFGSNNFAPFGNSVSVVDLLGSTIIKNIIVGIQPSGLAITPDGSKALVSNYNTLYAVGAPSFTDLTPGEGTVNIVNLGTLELVGPTIVVGQAPANIAVTPDGSKAYVSCFVGNSVSVVSI